MSEISLVKMGNDGIELTDTTLDLGNYDILENEEIESDEDFEFISDIGGIVPDTLKKHDLTMIEPIMFFSEEEADLAALYIP